MSELTNEQQRLFNKFIKIAKDEQTINLLDNFLQKIENNSLEAVLQNCEQIIKAYNGDENSMSIDKIREDIETSQEHIDEIYYKIFDIENTGQRNSSSALKDIQSAKDLANKIRADYQRFYGTKDAEGNIQKGIITKLNEACEQIENSQEQLDELKEFYDEIFEGTNKKEALAKHLENLSEDLQNLQEEYERKFIDLYESKKNEIEKLMPGAASVGLASAYKTEKEDIQKNITLWNKVFIGSIVIFILVFGIYFYASFSENFSYVSFLRALPFWIFSGFFSFYAAKQISEYKRLANEYAHKEALNTTYIAYKNEVENQENKELKQKLQDIMLENAKFNPSSTLSKDSGEIPSLSILEKIVEKLPIDMLRKLNEKIESLIKKP